MYDERLIDMLKNSVNPLFDALSQLQATAALDRVTPADRSDFQVAHSFLYNYRGSEATFNAYRREVERLLHWTWQVKKTTLPQLKPQDIEDFILFCQNPPTQWIAKRQYARFITKAGLRVPNPNWRPFVHIVTPGVDEKEISSKQAYYLSQKTVQAIFSILASFFNFLIQQDYMFLNPVAHIRQKSKFIRKVQEKAVVRRLGELQWHYVIETALQMAEAEPEKHERTLFIMQALYGMYLRISELTASARWIPKMGDFQVDHDGNWWFITVGKGNKQRQISVSHAMLMALKRYRSYCGFSPLPTPGENRPLIPHQKTGRAISSTRQIRYIVQYCFDEAYFRLQKDGFVEEATQLKAATVHWLRHTGISDDVKLRPREHVRDDAGHASSATTDRYIDIELRERHNSGKNKQIIPDLD